MIIKSYLRIRKYYLQLYWWVSKLVRKEYKTNNQHLAFALAVSLVLWKRCLSAFAPTEILKKIRQQRCIIENVLHRELEKQNDYTFFWQSRWASGKVTSACRQPGDLSIGWFYQKLGYTWTGVEQSDRSYLQLPQQHERGEQTRLSNRNKNFRVAPEDATWQAIIRHPVGYEKEIRLTVPAVMVSYSATGKEQVTYIVYTSTVFLNRNYGLYPPWKILNWASGKLYSTKVIDRCCLLLEQTECLSWINV